MVDQFYVKSNKTGWYVTSLTGITGMTKEKVFASRYTEDIADALVKEHGYVKEKV